MLALAYPIATIFFFWTLSGRVGPAETALDLNPNFFPVERAVIFLAVVAQVAAMRQYAVTNSFKWAVVAFSLAIVFAVVVSKAVAGVFGLALCVYFGAEVPLFSGVLLGFAWIVTFTFVGTLTLRDWPAVLQASAVAIILAATMLLNRAIPVDLSWKRVYLLLLIPGTMFACFFAAYFLSNLPVWNFIGPLLLFGTLMTALNAPFDWLSLGLTRGLLRRGLEKGGWAPLRLSLLDAALATFLIAALVPVLVLGAQFFDRIAAHPDGNSILPLQTFFDEMEADPFAPIFWWVYALLLSTMIPSLLNLGPAGFSIIRVFSGMSSFLLERLPADRPVASYDRTWIASCLTVQMVGGLFLGLAIQTLFAWGIMVHILPKVGLELLHIARWTANLGVPGLIGLR